MDHRKFIADGRTHAQGIDHHHRGFVIVMIIILLIACMQTSMSLLKHVERPLKSKKHQHYTYVIRLFEENIQDKWRTYILLI